MTELGDFVPLFSPAPFKNVGRRQYKIISSVDVYITVEADQWKP